MAFTTQAVVTNAGQIAAGDPWKVGQSTYLPLMAVPGNNGAKLSKALNVKLLVHQTNPLDPSSTGNSLDAGAMDVYIYYIIGA